MTRHPAAEERVLKVSGFSRAVEDLLRTIKVCGALSATTNSSDDSPSLRSVLLRSEE